MNWRRWFVLGGTLLWALLPVQVVGQQDTSVTAEEAAKVAGSLQQEIFTRLDSATATVVRGAEAGAEFTWPILVRQQVMEGAFYAFSVLFFSIGVWVTYRIVLVGNRHLEEGGHDDARGNTAMFIAMGTGVISGMGLFISLLGFFMGDGFTKILNPEYHALMDVFKVLGIS